MKASDFDYVRSHGLGNDYLVMDALRLGFGLTAHRVQAICDRHTGLGSDGILLNVPAAGTGADFAVRILNPDGSEAEKSGNGLRIFAKYLYEHGYTTKTEFSIYTFGGVVRVKLFVEGTRCRTVQVEMGRAILNRQLRQLTVDGQTLEVTVVSMGNPHCVTFVEDISTVDLSTLGPAIEKHRLFPHRTNVQFAQVKSRRAVAALVWERGAGHTLASGSSACAVATAAVTKGLVDSPVTVEMEGGRLTVEVSKDLDVVMTGPAEEICMGRLSRDFRQRLGV